MSILSNSHWLFFRLSLKLKNKKKRSNAKTQQVSNVKAPPRKHLLFEKKVVFNYQRKETHHEKKYAHLQK
jgi:hypothetical protein